jgi:hypothetical protein
MHLCTMHSLHFYLMPYCIHLRALGLHVAYHIRAYGSTILEDQCIVFPVRQSSQQSSSPFIHQSIIRASPIPTSHATHLTYFRNFLHFPLTSPLIPRIPRIPTYSHPRYRQHPPRGQHPRRYRHLQHRGEGRGLRQDVPRLGAVQHHRLPGPREGMCMYMCMCVMCVSVRLFHPYTYLHTLHHMCFSTYHIHTYTYIGRVPHPPSFRL